MSSGYEEHSTEKLRRLTKENAKGLKHQKNIVNTYLFKTTHISTQYRKSFLNMCTVDL